MKFALINEEQIHSIEFVLEYTRATCSHTFQREECSHVLNIVKSLKLQEPIAYGHWTSPAWSEEPVSLNTSVEKPSGFRTESANWFPLYAGDQP